MSAEQTSRRPDSPQAGTQPVQESGWPVLHLFQTIDRTRWQSASDAERTRAIDEFAALLQEVGGEEGMQLIASGVIGKADLALMAVHPDLRRIQQLTQQVRATRLGACLSTVYSFLSISEKSEYISTTGDHARKLIDEDGLAGGGFRRAHARLRRVAHPPAAPGRGHVGAVLLPDEQGAR
jgi:chlorite dismutase